MSHITVLEGAVNDFVTTLGRGGIYNSQKNRFIYGQTLSISQLYHVSDPKLILKLTKSITSIYATQLHQFVIQHIFSRLLNLSRSYLFSID